jgi:hypothetical protein
MYCTHKIKQWGVISTMQMDSANHASCVGEQLSQLLACGDGAEDQTTQHNCIGRTVLVMFSIQRFTSF